MIEVVQIRHNPVTLHEGFALDLTPGERERHFTKVKIVRRKMGGFWSAAVTWRDDYLALQEFFEQGLGRDITFRNDAGGVDWNGYVNTLRLTGPGGKVVVRSLEKMANKIWVRYRDAADAFQRSAVASDAASIARYGTKEMVLSGGKITSTSLADSLARQVLKRRKQPKAIVEDFVFGRGMSGGQVQLELVCLGYIHTLGWIHYNQTASTGTQSADLQMADIFATCGAFIADTHFDANLTGVTKEYDADQTGLEIGFNIAGLGDPYDQQWVLQVLENIEAFYRPASAAEVIDL